MLTNGIFALGAYADVDGYRRRCGPAPVLRGLLATWLFTSTRLSAAQLSS